MNQSIEQTGIPQDQSEGFVNAFFEQLGHLSKITD